MEKIINEEFLLRQFQPSDLPAFKELIKTTWNENHIFLKSERLMLWQYQGYGSHSGMHFPVLFNREGKLIGFRGVFPVEVNIPSDDGVKTKTMAVGALYLVTPEYRGKKLGLALQQFTQECYGNYLAIGSNFGTSAPIYKKSNYLMLERMHRYVAPFDNNYADLLLDSNTNLQEYFVTSNCQEETDAPLSASELEEIWKLSPCSKMLSINKSEAYWNWRYINHPIYKYYFFGGPDKGGLIVGRICNTYNDSLKKLKASVFRILEIIPSSLDNNQDFDTPLLRKLFKGVMKWAANRGCSGIETYMTSTKFNTLLSACGLYKIIESNNVLDIISNYEPITKSPKLTNVSIFLGGANSITDFESAYISLADSDQDRPNIIE